MEWKSLGWLLMPEVGTGLDSRLIKHLSLPRLCWSRLVHALRKTHQYPRLRSQVFLMLLEAAPSTAFGRSASGGCTILVISSWLRPHLRVLGKQVFSPTWEAYLVLGLGQVGCWDSMVYSLKFFVCFCFNIQGHFPTFRWSVLSLCAHLLQKYPPRHF